MWSLKVNLCVVHWGVNLRVVLAFLVLSEVWVLQVREPGLSLSSRPCIRTFLCPVLMSSPVVRLYCYSSTYPVCFFFMLTPVFGNSVCVRSMACGVSVRVKRWALALAWSVTLLKRGGDWLKIKQNTLGG